MLKHFPETIDARTHQKQSNRNLVHLSSCPVRTPHHELPTGLLVGRPRHHHPINSHVFQPLLMTLLPEHETCVNAESEQRKHWQVKLCLHLMGYVIMSYQLCYHSFVGICFFVLNKMMHRFKESKQSCTLNIYHVCEARQNIDPWVPIWKLTVLPFCQSDLITLVTHNHRYTHQCTSNKVLDQVDVAVLEPDDHLDHAEDHQYWSNNYN